MKYFDKSKKIIDTKENELNMEDFNLMLEVGFIDLRMDNKALRWKDCEISITNDEVLELLDFYFVQDYLLRMIISDYESKRKKITNLNLEDVFHGKLEYRAMSKVPQEYKDVLYYYFYEQYSLNESCRALHLPYYEIIKRKNKGIRCFRKNLEQELQTYLLEKKEGVVNE